MVSEAAVGAAGRSHVHIGSPGSFRLRTLSHEDCTKVHEASLEVLNTTGVVVTSAKTKSVFADHGAVVDQATDRVCLPPEFVEKALATVPSTVCIPGRDSSRDYVMGGGPSGFRQFWKHRVSERFAYGTAKRGPQG